MELEKQIEEGYRLCDSPLEVNWSARRKINLPFHRDVVLPSMLKFAEKAVKYVTYQKGNHQDMRVVVGVSGGIDSTLASYVIAESMQRSVKEGRSEASHLVLANFEGLENFSTAKIAEDLRRKYPLVEVRHVSSDIKPARRSMQAVLEDLASKASSGSSGAAFSGELTTRAICSIVNELSSRLNLATIDTTNGTEVILGEFSTGLGYDVVLLSDLYKSSVYALGEILHVPRNFLDQWPRNSAFGERTKAELYFGKVSKGVTPRQVFEVLDVVLYWLYEEGKSSEEVARCLGHSREFVRRVQARIKNQKPRRRPPVFSIQTHNIRYSNPNICDKDAKIITKKEMLGELFENAN